MQSFPFSQSFVCLAVLGVAAAGLIPAAPVAYVADHADHNGDYYVSFRESQKNQWTWSWKKRAYNFDRTIARLGTKLFTPKN